MNEKYSKAYVEVLEIIKNFSDKEYSKIPEEKIKFFEENKDKDYEFKINSGKDFSEQNISKEAETIMISLFRDYFATEKQKKILYELLKQNQEKFEEEKIKRYDPNNIFKKTRQSEEVALVEVKEENLIKKIWEFFKSIFKKWGGSYVRKYSGFMP